MSDADFTRRMRAQMRDPAPPPRELDFIKCLADAWDGRGNNVFTAGECRALWTLGYLDQQRLEEFGARQWAQLTPHERERLVVAARAAVSLGRVCQVLLQ